ncbi:MAG: hypothetical protein K0V04_01750 [Deltaproteobacteria bacterium]|nr:hypothetical protein [Deltaproteobacteria bacterium]
MPPIACTHRCLFLRSAFALGLVAFTSACTAGANDEDAGGGSSSGDPTAPGDTTESGVDASDSSGDVPVDPSACGATLREVSWFQTVEVPALTPDGAVDPAGRAAPLVSNRHAIIRARLDVDADWAPHAVDVRVDVTTGAGTESFTGSAMVDGSADDSDSGIIVDVPASAMLSGATYSVSIVECDGGGDGVRFPQDREAELGVVDTGPIRIHVVPFEVGGFVPDTSPQVLEGFRSAILAMYPATDVELTVLPVEPDQNNGQVDMGDLMIRLIVLQEELVFASGNLDPAVADIYYYGLVTGAATREEFCDTCPTGTSESGVGNRAGSAMGAAFADDLSESTLVHELGHMHGLLHSPCGDPSLQDDAFPYADGSTSVEGWDDRTETFVPPTHNDVMGYCQPRWVSDYHYAKMVEWIQLAQSWATASAMEGPPSHPTDRVECFGH